MSKFEGRKIYKGRVEGEALVTSEDISFYGGCESSTGIIVEKGHELEGKSVAGKILVFPSGKGSTVGSYVLFALKKAGLAPLAIVTRRSTRWLLLGVSSLKYQQLTTSISAKSRLDRN